MVSPKNQLVTMLVNQKKKRLLSVLELLVCGGVWSLVVFEGWIGLDRIGFYSILNTETFP